MYWRYNLNGFHQMTSHHFYSSNVSIKDSESTTFNALFTLPFLNAVADHLNECKPGFKHDEAPLLSMSNQQQHLGFYKRKDDTLTYLADGIIKLYELKGLEVMLPETSSHFRCKGKFKINFDHYKGVFGALAMLKTLADEFQFGTLETFCKCKVFFLHAADETLFLWSLRFEAGGPIFELWLEGSLKLIPEFQESLEFLPAMLNFFWSMKSLLTETIDLINTLRSEHRNIITKNRFNSNPLHTSLSTLVNPSILKLTEEEDKAGMHLLGPFFSP